MRDNFSLSARGYGVPLSRISKVEADGIIKELTVEPVINGCSFGLPSECTSAFQVYTASSTKIYVPKYYGLQKYGLPEEESIPEGLDISLHFEGQLRKEQEKPVNDFLNACKDPLKRGGIINLSCAGGKCLGKDTPIIMFDGSLKKVQDVCVGDKLMGDDGKERNVMSTCVGRDVLYKITPHDDHFDPYIVNSSHILSLISTETNEKIDLHILDYLSILRYYVDYSKFTHDGSNDPFVGYTYAPFFERENEDKGDYHRESDLYHRMRGYRCRSESLTSTPASIPHQSHTYHFDVEKLDGIGDYFGFEIDGNRRFLLGDCTVTHNTVIGLYVIKCLAKKTLIIVHKNFLLEQWRERINQFLPGARIGTLKAQTIDVKDKDIVIASLQSLSMKTYEKHLLDDIGFVIVDEIHRTGTEVFSKALSKVNFQYSLGLTATLERKDGLSKVFTWSIGDVVFKDKSRVDKVTIMPLSYFNKSPDYSKEEKMMNQKINTSKMITKITDFDPRTEFIIDAMHDLLRETELDGTDHLRQRRFLVLSDRKNHLQSIERILNDRIPDMNVGYYIGGMKDTELKESEKKDIILATYSFASEGFDVPGLDTLILASPKSNMEQIIGRILREKEEFRKNVPLVIDIVDEFSFFKNQALKRKRYYKKMKYNLIRG